MSKFELNRLQGYANKDSASLFIIEKIIDEIHPLKIHPDNILNRYYFCSFIYYIDKKYSTDDYEFRIPFNEYPLHNYSGEKYKGFWYRDFTKNFKESELSSPEELEPYIIMLINHLVKTDKNNPDIFTLLDSGMISDAKLKRLTNLLIKKGIIEVKGNNKFVLEYVENLNKKKAEKLRRRNMEN